jgi:hypothetical protein
MKKLLLLLFISPIIGNSQMLNEPVASIINLTGGESYTVGNGKALQFVSSGEVDGGQAYLRSDQYNTSINAANENQYGNPVFSNGTTITWLSNTYSTWVLYNLQSEPLPEKLEETTVSLNLPVDRVINIMGYDFAHYSGSFFEVPEGKILQLVGIINPNDAIGVNSDSVELHVSRLQQGQRTYVCEIGYIFSEYSRIGINNDQFDNSFFSFVMYDLGAQNLASNVPKQTTPTLYPNPTSSLLALNSDKEYDIEVYDMAGNKVMVLTGNTIDMSHLSSATYIVKALDKVENEEVSYKVVKN